METRVRLKSGSLGLCLSEAIAAVNGPIALWTKRHHGVVAAFSADYRIHFPGLVGIHSAALFGPADGSATPATFGLVGKPSGIENSCSPAVNMNSPPHSTHIKVLSASATAVLLVLATQVLFGQVGEGPG